MKIATKIAGFLMSCLTLCASLQPVATMAQNTEMARPRSTIDLSRTDRLTGTPSVDPTSVPSCPAGSTLSGGACVLISNQSSAMCAVGQVLRGIQNGAPVCVAESSGGGGDGEWKKCPGGAKQPYVPYWDTCRFDSDGM